MLVQAYLNFDGRCEEALNLYKKALGAEVTMLMRMNESPEPPKPGVVAPGSGDKVLHAAFRIGETMLLASDCYCSGKPVFQGISLTITARDEAEANRLFAALSDGGQVTAPLSKTFFSPRFGMVTDRFGVAWMVLVPQ
ncbi:MAG: VOC family protein [Betaproteobacteria bacterium]|nr:MAG: VOC family protein [Betaproteobacteria bacterium]